MEQSQPAGRDEQLRAALKRKIADIEGLLKTVSHEKAKTFFISTARLLEEIEGADSQEVTDFRRLDGRSGVVSADPHVNAQRDEKSYYSHLKTAESILTAVDESLEWRMPVATTKATERSTQMNNDAVKDAVLAHLYEKLQQQPNRTKGWSAKEIRSHLPQYETADVTLAVEYLSGEHWLTHTTERGTRFYRLSSKGLDKFQPSEYKSKPFSSVQINASNSVLVMGDNLGTVSQDNSQGIQDINALVELVKNAAIPQEQKLDVVSDLETIKAQLVKTRPDAGILKAAWTGVTTTLSAAATISGAADFVTKIGHFIGQLH